ncbi:DUF6119 family protein [Pedobacter jeongneungensis]|uniref:DUF6119 family protein n=1 Tax=Pedobacter jeongneungensis TaxID=947309 RepID=UPI000468E0DA|nr:DUF6119 family protein [Pedobacter jeongneungensis]
MSEKIQSSFYLLKDAITISGKGITKATTQTINDAYLAKLMKDKGYKAQKVTPNLNSNYDISLFFKKKTSDIKWKEFIASIAQPGEPILKSDKTNNESYILLLYSKKGKCYYASTGGTGHMVIQDIATNDLGLQILARILKPEDKALRSSKERSLVGGILGSVKIFRNDYNLYDNESFGSIYNELNATVAVDKLVNVFGFTSGEIKSESLCIAKNSFSIKKSISFKQLLQIITKCEGLLKTTPQMEINSVEKLGRGKLPLIKALNGQLDGKVYLNYLDPVKICDVEISHRDFEKYYLSTYTIFYFKIGRDEYDFRSDEPIREVQTLLDEIRKVDSTLSQADFERTVSLSSIITYDDAGTELTTDPMRSHYCTEERHNLKSYFLIEKDWYEIGKTMIDKINESCKSFLASREYRGPAMGPWAGSYDSENDYNASYIGDSNALVFDKFTPSNIEVCDILRWDQNNIYFYHVKKGFTNTMRDLCAQVLIAARRVQEDEKNGYQFLGKLYDTVTASKGPTQYSQNVRAQFANLKKRAFIDLFTNRKFIFVLAVQDTAKSHRTLLTQIDQFESNIAKFSLNELAKNMNNLEINFQIEQLR